MLPKHSWIVAFAAFLMVMSTLMGSAFAESAKTGSTSEAAHSSSAVKAEKFALEGFRSAKFGMTEEQVLAAIKSDFGSEGSKITTASNEAERTKSILVTTSNLLDDSGTAAVAYILGYKTKKLFQVNIVWGQPVVKDVETQKLVNTANALRNLFLSQGYEKEGLVANAKLPDGSFVVFQGKDAKGRTTILKLTVPTKPEETAKDKVTDASTLKGGTLLLSYLENPEKPDVFKIEKGF